MDGPEQDSPTQTTEQAMLGGIQSPAIDPETREATQKAFGSAAQAWGCYQNLKEAQNIRNGINSQIIDNYNGKAPYAEGEIAGWQSNFSALFMTGIIDKVVPVLTGYLENVKFLTQSKIKDSSPAGQQKTNRAREIVTTAIRQWTGWRPFISSLCQELILIGYTFAWRSDEYDWRPMHARQDQAFIPDGTKQSAEHVQIFCADQDFLIHELTNIIQDREVAEAAKWNVPNAIESLNVAIPHSPEEKDDGNNPRTWVDMQQEGSMGTGASYTKGARTVQTAHVMAVETGEGTKVTHLIIDRNGENKPLLWHEARFDSMRDVLTLFTLDPGNGNFYGSRGAGMRIVNYSVAMNTSLNDCVDGNRLYNLIVLQQDLAKGTPPPRIKRPFLYLNKDSQVIEQRQSVQASGMQASILLMDKMAALAQVATQQYIPNSNSAEEVKGGKGGKATAREVTIDYQREQQGVAAFIGRFAGQAAELIGMMQRAMLNPDTNDKEAMEVRELLLGNEAKGIPAVLTEDELKEFAESNTAEVLQDLTSIENQAKIAAANDPEFAMSPNIDQKARQRTKLDAMVPAPVAQAWWKDDAIDPNDEAEQIAMQIGETHDIQAGAPAIPVSGRHNHKVHLDVLLPDMMRGAAGLESTVAQNPMIADSPMVGKQLDHLHTGQAHAEGHVTKWSQQLPPPQGGEFEKYAQATAESKKRIEMVSQALFAVKQKIAAAKAAHAQQQQQQPPAALPAPAAAQAPEGGEDQQPGADGQPLPFTEKIATAFIGQFENLSEAEQRRLTWLCGLGTPATSADDKVQQEQEEQERQQRQEQIESNAPTDDGATAPPPLGAPAPAPEQSEEPAAPDEAEIPA